MDWYRWHERYDGPAGGRLPVVQSQIDAALAATSARPIRVLSICAGQGHDIVGSLRRFGGRERVRALLVESDGRNAAAARRRIAEAGLPGVTVEVADAGSTDVYREAVPADLIVLCGVFGSLTDQDIDRTVGTLPGLAAPEGQVVWTANRIAPGLWETALSAFDRHGFGAIWTDDSAPERFGVGRHRLIARSRAFEPGRTMFTFADEDTLVRIGRIVT